VIYERGRARHSDETDKDEAAPDRRLEPNNNAAGCHHDDAGPSEDLREPGPHIATIPRREDAGDVRFLARSRWQLATHCRQAKSTAITLPSWKARTSNMKRNASRWRRVSAFGLSMTLLVTIAGGCRWMRHDQSDDDTMLLVGYDLDIASEARGEPVQAADKSWTSHWLYILSALKAEEPPDRAKLWVRYIVACRNVAGLPDLPGYPSAGANPPPKGCNASGVRE